MRVRSSESELKQTSSGAEARLGGRRLNGTSGTRALPETTRVVKRLNGTYRTRALRKISSKCVFRVLRGKGSPGGTAYRNHWRCPSVSALGTWVCARGQKVPPACGKACGIGNHVRDFFQQRPIGRFWEGSTQAFKAMNSNQLCNSSGINMTPGQAELVLFRF